MLWYSTPDYAPLLDVINIDQPEEKAGYYQIEDIVKPRAIKLYTEDGQEKIAYPGNIAFTDTMEWLRTISISNIEKYKDVPAASSTTSEQFEVGQDDSLANENEQDINQQQGQIVQGQMLQGQMLQGQDALQQASGQYANLLASERYLSNENSIENCIEIEFFDSMSIEYIKMMIPIDNNELDNFNDKLIKRVRIFVDEDTDTIKCLYIGNNETFLGNVNVTKRRFVELVKDASEQQFTQEKLIIEFSKQPIRVAELSNSVFADPTAIRQIQEKDQSVIYTDGSRGLRINTLRQTIEFTNPTISSRFQEANFPDMIADAIDFLNRHQSWAGEYILSGIEVESVPNNEYTLVFQQHMQGLPIMNIDSFNCAEIRMKMKNNKVTRMNRSTTYLGEQTITASIIPLEKQDMQSIIERRAGISGSEYDLFLSYYPISLDIETVKLQPAWILNQNNSFVTAFDSQTGQEIRE